MLKKNRLKNGTIVRIGNNRADTFAYTSVVGMTGRIIGYMGDRTFSHYEVETVDSPYRWFIQPIDCIPVEPINENYLLLLKEEW